MNDKYEVKQFVYGMTMHLFRSLRSVSTFTSLNGRFWFRFAPEGKVEIKKKISTNESIYTLRLK